MSTRRNRYEILVTDRHDSTKGGVTYHVKNSKQKVIDLIKKI